MNLPMNKKPRNAIMGFILSLAMIFTSCDPSYLGAIDNLDDYTYSPVFAFPLLNSDLSFKDLFFMGDLDNIELDEDRMIIISYDARIFSLSASRIFSIPNQNQMMNISGITPPPSGSITTEPRLFLFTFDQDEKLFYVRFEEGLLELSAESPMMQQDGYELEVSFMILNSDNGQGESIQGTASPGNPALVDLRGSSITFGENSPNVFLIEYTMTFAGDGQPDNAPYTVELYNSLTNMEFDYIEGYIDQISFPVGGANVSLSIFNNAFDGSIQFENPNIEFFITNTFGLEIDLITEEISATLKNETIIPITGPAFDNPWRVVQPPDTSYYLVSRQNTDFFDITLQSPRILTYDVSGITNPDGPGSGPNWVSRDSDLTIDMKVNLPMWGRIDYFYLRDTISSGLSELPDEIEWMELSAITTNEFPFSVELFIELVDENYNVLDTLFKDQPKLLAAATTDPATGITVTPSVSQSKAMLDDVLIASLIKADKVLINTIIRTYDSEAGTVVKLLDNYRVGVELGVRGKANYTPVNE